jgi:antitoxin component of MazEF toxin-antitoxin module
MLSMVRATLRRWGNSLGFVINAKEVKKRGLVAGMEIEFEPTPVDLAANDVAALLRGKITRKDVDRMLRELEKDDGWRD